jgi:hypothetical protein
MGNNPPFYVAGSLQGSPVKGGFWAAKIRKTEMHHPKNIRKQYFGTFAIVKK